MFDRCRKHFLMVADVAPTLLGCHGVLETLDSGDEFFFVGGFNNSSQEMF